MTDHEIHELSKRAEQRGSSEDFARLALAQGRAGDYRLAAGNAQTAVTLGNDDNDVLHLAAQTGCLVRRDSKTLDAYFRHERIGTVSIGDSGTIQDFAFAKDTIYVARADGFIHGHARAGPCYYERPVHAEHESCTRRLVPWNGKLGLMCQDGAITYLVTPVGETEPIAIHDQEIIAIFGDIPLTTIRRGNGSMVYAQTNEDRTRARYGPFDRLFIESGTLFLQPDKDFETEGPRYISYAPFTLPPSSQGKILNRNIPIVERFGLALPSSSHLHNKRTTLCAAEYLATLWDGTGKKVLIEAPIVAIDAFIEGSQ